MTDTPENVELTDAQPPENQAALAMKAVSDLADADEVDIDGAIRYLADFHAILYAVLEAADRPASP